MKYTKYFYIIYTLVIIALTVYFSIKIINPIATITGKFSFPIQNAKQTISNEESLLRELKKYNSVPDEIRSKTGHNYRNSEGFQDYEHEIIKPNKIFRIITLGDSFTEGAWILINDTWPKQLERKLNQLNTSQFEVLNFGRGGAGTLEELKIFKENALKYNSDMVILLYYPNDWEDTLQIKKRANELWSMYKNGSFKFPVDVEEKIKELNASEADVSRLVMQVATEEFWDYANQRGIENIWKESVETPLSELISICNERKIDLIVLGLDLDKNQMSKQYDKTLNNFLEKNKVPFLDLTSYFPYNNELRLPDGHLSEKGYDLLSTKLLEFLFQSNKITKIKTR